TAKRKTTLRSKDKWLKIIEAWKSSQKSIKCWCNENNIPDSSFRSAYNRLFPSESSHSQELPIFQRSCFQELEETTKSINGIELFFKGFTLKISQQFNESFLLNLLKVLEKL